jgi:hypothetical protein
MQKILIGFLLQITLVACLQGQFPGAGQQGDPFPEVAPDSVETIDRTSFFDIFYGNPGRAALYSLVIPAGGQIYNRRWWKVPMVWGLHGSAIYLIHTNGSRAREFKGIWEDLLMDKRDNIYGITDPNQARNIRQNFQRNTEYSWAFLIIAHLVTVFDAFVDRHLIEFDVSDDLSIRIIPDASSFPGQMAGLGFQIPLHSKYKYGKPKPNYLF